MPRTNEFCDYVADRLAPLGTVTYRFMFGGYSIYLDGLTIAIVADDALLLRADEETRAMLLRPPTDALVRLFPVLGRVPGLTRAPSTEVGDEAHARRQAIAALRELLTRLTTIAPLVLSIDDLQWGDNDSATLLREVLRPPGAPPLLLILSYRTEDRGGIPLLKVLNQLARDAAAVRTRRMAPRTGTIGMELPLDHDLRVDADLSRQWWNGDPGIGALRSRIERDPS